MKSCEVSGIWIDFSRMRGAGFGMDRQLGQSDHCDRHWGDINFMRSAFSLLSIHIARHLWCAPSIAISFLPSLFSLVSVFYCIAALVVIPRSFSSLVHDLGRILALEYRLSTMFSQIIYTHLWFILIISTFSQARSTLSTSVSLVTSTTTPSGPLSSSASSLRWWERQWDVVVVGSGPGGIIGNVPMLL
jgi:hypothetical protein